MAQLHLDRHDGLIHDERALGKHDKLVSRADDLVKCLARRIGQRVEVGFPTFLPTFPLQLRLLALLPFTPSILDPDPSGAINCEPFAHPHDGARLHARPRLCLRSSCSEPLSRASMGSSHHLHLHRMVQQWRLRHLRVRTHTIRHHPSALPRVEPLRRLRLHALGLPVLLHLDQGEVRQSHCYADYRRSNNHHNYLGHTRTITYCVAGARLLH